MNIYRTAYRWLDRAKFALAAWLVWLLIKLLPGRLPWTTGFSLLPGLACLFMFGLLLGCVFSVVRHADELAERLGEPYGTLVLTLSATSIEAALMLSLMMAGQQNPTLLRDTVFATLMVVLNGLVGLSLTAGGWRHVEQAFNLRGALAFLHIIAPLSLMILVLPNYTTEQGAVMMPAQEGFMGVLCILVYAVFLRLQTGRHRSHFDHVVDHAASAGNAGSLAYKHPITRSFAALAFALLPIMLLSESMAALLEHLILDLHLPAALGGLLVTCLVLAPEGLGAFKAALDNRVQRSINICLGSALSTIALTIPTVLVAAAVLGHALILGIDPLSVTLLYASLTVAIITFISGRANLLQGTVHLMIFAAYLFFMFNP
jgi:Ca2+:H+ antiporter